MSPTISESLIASFAYPSHSGHITSSFMFTIQVNELQPPEASAMNSEILNSHPISMRQRSNHFGCTPQDIGAPWQQTGSDSRLMCVDKFDA